jgi:hypothetical protein
LVQDEGVIVKTLKKVKTLTWHFVAPMVHDFAWAAKNYYTMLLQDQMMWHPFPV